MDDIRNNFAAEDASSIKLIDVWNLIWNHKWWYVIGVAIALVAAGVKLYRSPAIYSRTAKVIIDEGAQEAAMRDISSFTGSMSRLRYSTNVDNEVEAFASPDLMELVAERLGLQATYVEHQFFRNVELGPNTPVEMCLAGANPTSSFSFEVFKNSDKDFTLSKFHVGAENSKELESVSVRGCLGDTLQTPVGAIVLQPTLHAEKWDKPISVSWRNTRAAGKRLSRAVSVSISSKQTSVVVLGIKDRYPARAEAVLDCLIDVYNESWVQNRNRSARKTTDFINDRLVVIESELGAIETDLKNFKEKNNLPDVKAMSNIYVNESSQYAEKSFEINNQLSIARYLKEYLNNPANTLSLIPSNSGLTSSHVESQINSYNELILRRDALLTNTTEDNPLVSDINHSLESIKTSILRSIDNLISTLKIQADQIERQEKLVMSHIAATTSKEFDLISIERQRKVKESLYVYLLQKREENELTSLMNVSNTRLIMSPNGDNAPIAPRRMVILLIALMCGMGIPFAFFFLRKTMNNTVECKKDITDVLTMPYLAEIPQAEGKRKLLIDLSRFREDDDKIKRPIVVKAGMRNVINESFRVLRTNVDMMLGSTSGCKVVMSSSMYPGSGKTFVTMNLASSMAIKGAKTLMVDLDMRKASLSNSLDVHGPGIASFLSQHVEDLDSCITKVSDNLDVIGVGTLPPNPSELLLTGQFGKFIEFVRTRYDYVFIDCPPAEVVADASIISEKVDLTAFIVRAGLMDKRNLPVVEELYKSGKYKRMAVILNGLDASSHYGQYRRYGYGYSYGSDKN